MTVRQIFEHLDPDARKKISLSVYEGVYFAVMIGAAESYFGAYGVALDATPPQLGILCALPPFFCALCQMASIWLLNRYPSRRPIICVFSTIQALFILPIAMIPLFFNLGSSSVWALIVLAILYSGAAGVVAPIWNSLIGDLVPADYRGRFFGIRNQWMGIATLATMLGAGAILHVFPHFAAIFAIAFVARLGSVYFLRKHDNPDYTPERPLPFSLRRLVQRCPDRNFGRFVFFVSVIQGINAFAGPYYAPYMLKHLHLPYMQFSLITAAPSIALILMHPWWGRLVDSAGCKRVLQWSSFCICLNPFLWLLTSDTRWLFGVQLFSGIGWSGFNLASAAFLFDAVPRSKRAYYAAYQGLILGIFVLVGSLLGAWVVDVAPPLRLLDGSTRSPFLALFLISGCLRIATWLFLLHRFEDGRMLTPKPRRPSGSWPIPETDRTASL